MSIPGSNFTTPIKSSQGQCISQVSPIKGYEKASLARDEILSSFTIEQQEAIKLIDSGKNVFITGGAGTGKSFILQYYCKNEKFIKLAPTGTSAVNIEGMTYHYKLMIDVVSGGQRQKYTNIASAINTNFITLSRDNVLVFDEISMISGETLDMLNYTICKKMKDERPFGGLQVIFIGDFFQLPPIFSTPNYFHCDNMVFSRGFAFNSCVWNSMQLDVVVLEVSIRHNGDLEFHKILNKIRMGKFSRFELERYFCNNIVYNEVESSHNSCIEFSEDSYVGAESSLIKVSKLECINGDVDNGNNKCFEELPGESIEYSLLNFKNETMISLDRNVKDVVKLKIGAQVMLIKNMSLSNPYLVNGSRGIITGFVPMDEAIKQYEEERQRLNDLNNFRRELGNLGMARIAQIDLSLKCMRALRQSGFPEVLFENNVKRVILPTKLKQEYNNPNDICCSLNIPLKLAWYITVHKAQGLSLSIVDVNLEKAFGCGMVYVALSRASSIEGLRIRGFNRKKIKVDMNAIEADARGYRNCETWIDEDKLKRLYIMSDDPNFMCERCKVNAKVCEDVLGPSSNCEDYSDYKRRRLD